MTNHGPALALQPVIPLGHLHGSLQVCSSSALGPGTLGLRKNCVHGLLQHFSDEKPIPIGGPDNKQDHSSRGS